MRKTFEIMKSDEDIPKQKYSYRIIFNKLANVMTFIQGSLLVKSNVVRDLNIVGNIFRNLPVYERGGKSIESLTEAYNNFFVVSEHVGKHNIVLKSDVEDGNDIVIEDHILDALSFQGGIAGTSALPYDCSPLPETTLDRKYKFTKVRSRATHEIVWNNDKVLLYEASSISDPEMIKQRMLDRYKPNKINAQVVKLFRSTKPPLFVTGSEDIQSSDHITSTLSMSTKSTTISNALLKSGIVRNESDNHNNDNQSFVSKPPNISEGLSK